MFWSILYKVTTILYILPAVVLCELQRCLSVCKTLLTEVGDLRIKKLC
jgi:hypothetical protein